MVVIVSVPYSGEGGGLEAVGGASTHRSMIVSACSWGQPPTACHNVKPWKRGD
jgi:hypothetical protein